MTIAMTSVCLLPQGLSGSVSGVFCTMCYVSNEATANFLISLLLEKIGPFLLFHIFKVLRIGQL